ncbi:hypothetical protein BN2497_12003 [Janthinobacterium sp. CG23_2]|nr:hypothetical protein BN2497_12003 [Janthinobacterium sp. CG23_2]CUU32399.1 hypothetical protein BN3177_12003 [Janthinobacterium sp. CG23_2]
MIPAAPAGICGPGTVAAGAAGVDGYWGADYVAQFGYTPLNVMRR